MTAPAVWQLAALLTVGTFVTLLTVGTIFTVYDWLAMRKAARNG